MRMTKMTMMGSSRRSRAATAAAALALLLASAGAPTGAAAARHRNAEPARATAKSATPALARGEAAPFARVYLALKGCTSCAHCRTTLRQMVRSGAKGGEAVVADDRVEVRYRTPRAVPLRDVIQTLARNRLHDMSVVDVLFEATGTLTVGKDGAGRFTIPATGQSFPISISSALERPGVGPVRVVALVDGWRGKGSLSLVARELRTGA